MDTLNPENIPQHVALIMDGNGRWAKSKGEHRLYGHSKGVETVREVIKTGMELGIKYLTFYAFSTENWNRPKDEVNGLMDLLVESLTKELDELDKEGIRLFFIGELEGLPLHCQKSLKEGIKRTKGNKKMTLVVAINYSSKLEILSAVKKIAEKSSKGQLNGELTTKTISEHLWTKDIPDPELLIRTSGEHRISNFLLWQLAYAELYFTNVFWPDFKKEDLIKAIKSYQGRERRFGMVSEQILDKK